MSSDELQIRVARLEKLIIPLIELAQNHDERMDYLTETMNTLGERVTALVDAQIRTEDRVAELTQNQTELVVAQKELFGAQKRLAEAQIELADSVRHTDERLNALIDIVSQGRGNDLA